MNSESPKALDTASSPMTLRERDKKRNKRDKKYSENRRKNRKRENRRRKRKMKWRKTGVQVHLERKKRKCTIRIRVQEVYLNRDGEERREAE